jgi:hypothetical protein
MIEGFTSSGNRRSIRDADISVNVCVELILKDTIGLWIRLDNSDSFEKDLPFMKDEKRYGLRFFYRTPPLWASPLPMQIYPKPASMAQAPAKLLYCE